MSSLLSQRIEVSPRRWILLPIGFALKAREFHGNAMLAFEAAERGWGVIIGSKAIRYNAVLPRGMLIEKNIAPGTGKKIAVSLTVRTEVERLRRGRARLQQRRGVWTAQDREADL